MGLLGNVEIKVLADLERPNSYFGQIQVPKIQNSMVFYTSEELKSKY